MGFCLLWGHGGSWLGCHVLPAIGAISILKLAANSGSSRMSQAPSLHLVTQFLITVYRLSPFPLARVLCQFNIDCSWTCLMLIIINRQEKGFPSFNFKKFFKLPWSKWVGRQLHSTKPQKPALRYQYQEKPWDATFHSLCLDQDQMFLVSHHIPGSIHV